MTISQMKKLAFGGNLCAIGFISNTLFVKAVEGNLNFLIGSILAILIVANAVCAYQNWKE